jgi:hypothetical protein
MLATHLTKLTRLTQQPCRIKIITTTQQMQQQCQCSTTYYNTSLPCTWGS